MSVTIAPLVLFDIDGTLLVTGGATSRSIRRTCREILGPRFEWSEITPGLLDPQIFDHLARHNGCEDPELLHEAYRSRYLAELEAELDERRADVAMLPGIEHLVSELGGRQLRGEVELGLLTGNYGAAALLKLRAAGLDPAAFPVRAFAEDGRDRQELLAVALARYGELAAARPDPTRVIVVGDTPRDIACAHAESCVAFSVATGWYDAADLQAAGADQVVADFTSPAPLLDLLAELAGPSGRAR